MIRYLELSRYRELVRKGYNRVLGHSSPLFFKLISLPVALLPLRFAVELGGAVGWIFYHLSRRTRGRAIQNLTNSLPFLERHPKWSNSHGTVEQIICRSFVNLGRCVAELVKVYYGRGQQLIDPVEIRGIENYRRAKELGKGVTLITGHCGNWELMGLVVGVYFERIHVLARPLKEESLSVLLENVRSRFGNQVIYKEGAVRKALAVLREQGVVAILADVSVKPLDGILTDFLGRQAWTGTLAANLGRKTGVPLVPIFIHREGDRHVVDILPHLAVEGDNVDDTTRLLSRMVEEYIVQHPDEWLWIYRRWKRAADQH
ncbi:MAG: lipid A biosynthesis acyltransferase [Desulfuromonadales bacterium]|nr:MAG: lipid A biosynthesis acyltransferase [Desulfuromonadales bacterium]